MKEILQLKKRVTKHTNELCKEINIKNTTQVEETCKISLFLEEKYNIEIHVHSLCPLKCKKCMKKTDQSKFTMCGYGDTEEL